MTQQLPKSYGTIKWQDDMDRGGVDTTSDLESLEQDVVHILSEALGSNLADRGKGVGVMGFLSGTSVQLAQLPRLIDAQLAQVTRVTQSQTTLTQQADGSLLVQVQIAVGPEVTDLRFALGPGGLTRV